MKVEILYYANTLPHPANHKVWGKKYSEIHFGDKASIKLSKGFFQKHWRLLPLKEEVSIQRPIEQEMDRLFAKYNNYDTNPYGDDIAGQRQIKELNTHTSMSVGDVIKVKGIHYMVAGHGFKRLFLTTDKRRKSK